MSVAQSSSSLLVQWQEPSDARGSPIESYTIEWYAAKGRAEVQVVEVSDASAGTYRLKLFGDVTTFIPHDASAERMETALEALDAVNDVRVERLTMPDLVNSDGTSSLQYKITFAGVFGEVGDALVVDSPELSTDSASAAPASV